MNLFHSAQCHVTDTVQEWKPIKPTAITVWFKENVDTGFYGTRTDFVLLIKFMYGKCYRLQSP